MYVNVSTYIGTGEKLSTISLKISRWSHAVPTSCVQLLIRYYVRKCSCGSKTCGKNEEK